MEQQAAQRLEGESSAQDSQDVVTKGPAGCDTCLNGEDPEAAGKDLESGREGKTAPKAIMRTRTNLDLDSNQV